MYVEFTVVAKLPLLRRQQEKLHIGPTPRPILHHWSFSPPIIFAAYVIISRPIQLSTSLLTNGHMQLE